MNLNLSSQIVLNKVPVEFFRPRNAVERSELTRQEKIDTEIFPDMEEGAAHIADEIEKGIREKAEKGETFVLGLGTGLSLTPIFRQLIRRHIQRAAAPARLFRALLPAVGQLYLPCGEQPV